MSLETDYLSTTSSELLEITANNYEMSPLAYCERMRHEKTWGGKPQLIALCNFLRRPIHVYVLDTNIFSDSFELKLHSRFGCPSFSSKGALRILCADGRLVC